MGGALDPRQFAYRASREVEDAKITLLDLLYRHLEGPGTHARLLFLDFSSAFNTIQPHVLVSKLLSEFNIESNLVSWIMDFLTNRTQRVKVNGCLSERRVSSTGSPQGCVLSPLLYILYTNDCRSQNSNRQLLSIYCRNMNLSMGQWSTSLSVGATGLFFSLTPLKPRICS